ncbi:glycosyltransferase [Brachyspira intermedia PWS/A]|uniref:Glycosyltransferase n=1 Tax=Brachyspira intermedia (strain ATCC 51140 / PWS/A) TaxID=1045858 RepID=G0EQH8_BRAIP|nr:glycosyltransferase [Brachyspira intermedia PWS/A]
MYENIKKDIDNVVWWIPFKKLRNSLKNYLLQISDLSSKISNLDNKLNNLDNKLNNLDNRIPNIVENDLNYIKEKIGYADIRTYNIDIRTINMEKQINSINKDIRIKLNHIASEEYNYDKNIFNSITPPYISIIVPIYNIGKEYLLNCLNSLVNQTLKEIEIILVNDCSPNEEDDLICQEYALKDKRIKYIKHKKIKVLAELE